MTDTTPLLKFSKTHLIFKQPHKVIKNYDMLPLFIDDDLKNKVSKDDFDHIFNAIDSFVDVKTIHHGCDVIGTNLGDVTAFSITWRNELYVLKLMVYNQEGEKGCYSTMDDSEYVIIFTSTDNKTFLIVGNELGHPFVLTPTFHFSNSDGSTLNEYKDYLLLGFDKIKEVLKEKAIEYIFNQDH